MDDFKFASVPTIRAAERTYGDIDWRTKKRRARAALVKLEKSAEKRMRRVLVQGTHWNPDGILEVG